MRIAVMGSGGLGGFVGGRLASVGVDVLFIARGPHLQAMQKSGLRVLSETGDVSLQRVDATADPKGQQPVDFVIFTVKGPDTIVSAELIAPIVGSETGIISFQNGVEGIDILAARYSANSVLPGTSSTPAMIEKPGVIRHVGMGTPFTIGEWDGRKSKRAETFQQVAASAGLDMSISENIHTDVWSKFVAMATFSAITCLTRLPVRTIVTIPETRQLAIDSMNEVIAVANARGITLPSDTISTILAFVEKLDPSWKTSMCNDLEAGKVIEVESISGAIHRLGQELDVTTPVHTVAYHALKPYTIIRD
jgi:2-dehydropantoate 2-reductase